MLQTILAAAEHRIEALPPVAELRSKALDQPEPRDFAAALRRQGLQVIAEIKRMSPSAGPLDLDLDPAGLAQAYATGGAAAISVLTEPRFFGGSLDDLAAVATRLDVPVLRKDFIIDPAQVWEARLVGADAVLLIVAALDDAALAELIGVAEDAGLAALVEVHTADEAARAIASGAAIVGVNNRDLATFVTDLGVAERISELLPDTVVRVAESGVSIPAAAARMAAAGYDAILVGEALVRSPDPANLVGRLRRGA